MRTLLLLQCFAAALAIIAPRPVKLSPALAPVLPEGLVGRRRAISRRWSPIAPAAKTRHPRIIEQALTSYDDEKWMYAALAKLGAKLGAAGGRAVVATYNSERNWTYALVDAAMDSIVRGYVKERCHSEIILHEVARALATTPCCL